MRCVPENSDRCISLHSMEPCLHSRDAGSSNCPLCRHRCLCNLLLIHLHHERWMFYHHQDHFLQTTAQGDQRMLADPPVDKRLPWNTPVSNLNEKFRNVYIRNQWSYILKFSSFQSPLQLFPFKKYCTDNVSRREGRNFVICFSFNKGFYHDCKLTTHCWSLI